MTINTWPRDERPREKLLKKGASSLSDAELLAIFFRTGVKGKSAVELARDALNEFNGLQGLIQANFQDFNGLNGLGLGKYAQLQGALELGKRLIHARLSRQCTLKNPQSTRDFLKISLRNYQHEVFACLFLDNRHRVICFEELFTGTIDGASVYPREVVKRALQHNAAAVILSHNHPSGVAEPSLADRNITTRLVQALDLVDIRVLDHIVIGGAESVSFAERGLL